MGFCCFSLRGSLYLGIYDDVRLTFESLLVESQKKKDLDNTQHDQNKLIKNLSQPIDVPTQISGIGDGVKI